jgi:uncharacterized protein YecT (DUF1311 family)
MNLADRILRRTMPASLLIAAGLLLASAPAIAQEAACTTAPTQAAMNACAYDDFLAATSGYAERYRALSKPLPAAQRDRLRRMQTAWIGFRTAACRFESGPTAGGSAQDFVYWRCAARMTRERSAELERMASCREGDITCTRTRP